MEKLSFYQKFSTNSRVNILLIKRLITVERKNVTLVENSEKSSKKIKISVFRMEKSKI